MEYKDYKTGSIITREEYIKNGLGRGELLEELRCGCVIIQDRTAGAYIVYCHKHTAAPDMYEALREIREWIKGDGVRVLGKGFAEQFGVRKTFEKIDKALAKAEGRLL